jgi:hypothetical protein
VTQRRVLAANAALFGGRASSDDWLAADTLSKQARYPVPGYIIDYDGIYRYDASNAGIQIVPNGVIVITKARNAGVYKSWPRFDPARVCGRP